MTLNVGTNANEVFWSPATGTVTRYQIQRRLGTGVYGSDILAAVGAGGILSTDVSRVFGTIYFYRVRALNTLASPGPWSDEVSTHPPVAPTLSNFEAVPTGLEVALSWDVADGRSDITGYTLTRKLGSDTAVPITPAPAIGVTTFTDTVPAAGVYTFSLIATNAVDGSTPATVTATTIAPPGKVTGVTVSAGTNANEVFWSPATGTVTRYQIQRRLGTGVYGSDILAAVGAGGILSTDVSRVFGTIYFYRVRALNTLASPGEWSDEVSTHSPTLNNFEAVPTGLGVALTWEVANGGGSDITGYTLTRKLGSDTAVPITPAPATGAMTFTNIVSAAGVYTYSLIATNLIGPSAAVTATATATVPPPAPGKVPDVTVSAGTNANEVFWSPATGTVTRYQIQRRLGTGVYGSDILAAVGAGGILSTDVSRVFGTIYFYRVRALNTLASPGEWSDEVSTHPTDTAPTLTNFAAVQAGSLGVALTWEVENGGSDITGYTLTRKLGSEAAETITPAPAIAATTLTDTVPVPGDYTYTLIATNGIGDSMPATVAITVNPAAPIITASVPTLTATAGTAITAITIDASSGGEVASYSIAPAIANGLEFDTTSGTISGTPTAVAVEVEYTITATNITDTDTATVTITVNPPAPIITASVPTLTAMAGTAITAITIDATGGGTVASYSIAPAIANGLEFDTTSGTISGTPTAAAVAVEYTITATNITDTDTATVTITVNPAAPIITASTSALIATAGTAITDITIDASAGGTVASYSIAPALPNGLTFSTVTGTISGTPTVVAVAVEYTITATNITDTDTATVAITVAAALAEPIISTSVATLTTAAGTAIAEVTIDSTGGAVASYSIEPAITMTPGLTFDTDTGSISGTPTVAADAVIYTITATNAGGEDTAEVAITVAAALAEPIISTSVATLIATAGTAIAEVTIDSTGGAVASYSIEPAITMTPGLAFDTDSGSISGTPTVAADAVTYTITATNAGGEDTATVAITVAATLAVPIISASVATLIATAGTAIADVTIDSTGGEVASYSIEPAITMTPGLAFDTDSGSISGTPTAAAVEVTYTITAMNAAGTDTATVAITVNAAPTANAGADQTVAEGAAVTLNGFASSDPERETLTYAWTQTAPTEGAGSGITLTGADTAAPTFITPSELTANATLIFSLIVTDARALASTADTVTITVVPPMRLNDAWRSDNGIAWVEVAQASWTARSAHAVGIYKTAIPAAQSSFIESAFIVGGKTNVGVLADVWASDDGVNWVKRDDAPWEARSGHTTVFFNGRVYVIGGVDKDNEGLSDNVWSYGFEPSE